MATKKIKASQIWKELKTGEFYQVVEVKENLVALQNVTTNERRLFGRNFVQRFKFIG